MNPEMTVEAFRTSLSGAEPPKLSAALRALWWDAKGDWHRAHEAAQAGNDQDGDWAHAYLHRKEGDLPNARYWYSRVGRTMPAGSLDEEWTDLVSSLLGRTA